MKLAEQLYWNIIIGAEQRNLPKTVYVENHHAIPECISSKFKKYSKELKTFTVKITYKEHMYCHWLLTKIYPKNKGLKLALNMMGSLCNKGKRIFDGNIDILEKARTEYVKSITGVKLNKAHKLAIKLANIGKHNFKHLKSSRIKMSKSHLGKKTFQFT